MSEQLSLLDLFASAPPRTDLPELWTADDIYLALDASNVSSFLEDGRIERKSARKSLKDLADDLSAFANAQPHGGVLLVGVEDDGTISGFSLVGRDRLASFEGTNPNCPDARVESRRVGVINSRGDEDVVVAIRIHFRADRLVETTSGNAFVREGKQKRKLTETEKREIRITRGELDYEKEPVALSYPDHFRVDLIEDFCRSFTEKRSLSKTPSAEEILAWNHLGKIVEGRFVPNLACALLFANDPREACPGARVRFQRFSGYDEGSGSTYNLIKDMFIDGPLPELIRQADDAVNSQMRNFTRLGKDGRFYTKPEYPRDAWIEAIVNACVHRSYNFKNMTIFVKMFDDRFVVESPGGFPPPVDETNIYEFHNPRNPHLMEALFYFGFVKCAHEGTRRMRDLMKDSELPPPEFTQKEVGHHQVHVTLRNNFEARKTFVDASAAKVLGEALFSKLEPREKMVVNYVAENGAVNVSDANRVLQCDWRTARNVLDRLAERGVLERVSSGRDRDPKTHYRLRET